MTLFLGRNEGGIELRREQVERLLTWEVQRVMGMMGAEVMDEDGIPVPVNVKLGIFRGLMV